MPNLLIDPSSSLAYFALFENPVALLVLLAVVLVLFGGSRIKELMGGLGSGVREFKKGLNDDDTDKGATQSKSTADPAEPATVGKKD